MYNKYTGQLETHNVIHDYIENENKILDRLTDEKIQRHYIQEIERLNNELTLIRKSNNYGLDIIKEKDKEIERLNNIIKDIKSQLDYLETYSSKEDVFEDMKRRLDKIENIVNRRR